MTWVRPPFIASAGRVGLAIHITAPVGHAELGLAIANRVDVAKWLEVVAGIERNKQHKPVDRLGIDSETVPVNVLLIGSAFGTDWKLAFLHPRCLVGTGKR